MYFITYNHTIPTAVNLNKTKKYPYLQLLNFNKEVFVKHEQAPTAPKLEGVWVFVDLKYILYENRYFWSI